jgi:hypothetical protein
MIYFRGSYYRAERNAGQMDMRKTYYPRLDKNVGCWSLNDSCAQNPCTWLVVMSRHVGSLRCYTRKDGIKLKEFQSALTQATKDGGIKIVPFSPFMIWFQRRKCSLMKKGRKPLYSAKLPSFSSCLDQAWNILFPFISWSEENFFLCNSQTYDFWPHCWLHDTRLSSQVYH